MSSKIESGNGAEGKGTAPTPTPIMGDLDMAGMAVEMQSLMPDPKLLPLYYLTLKLSHDELARKLDGLISSLKDKGIDV